MRPAEIAARAAVIRLERSKLSELAGVSARSTREIFAGERPGARMATVDALENALLAEELRLLKHLFALHGVPTGGNGSGHEPIPAAAGEAVS